MGASSVVELQRGFGIPNIAEVVAGNGGLPVVRVKTPSAEGEMYLNGGHVTSWKPTGTQEVLFVSRQSRWETGRAIRGGVPVCFPWFGDNAENSKAPAHGFARIRSWQLLSIEQNGDAVSVSMFLESDAETKKWWQAEFRLVHRVTFSATLTLELVLTNTGSKPLRFEEALHAYYSIGDIRRARLSGLDSVHYLDKTDANREKTQSGGIAISAETDLVYLNTAGKVEIRDSAMRRLIAVTKENSLTTVIWNPWEQKAKAMSDLGDDEWKQMVCVEVSNVNKYAVEVAPGQRHSMKAMTEVVAL